MWICAQEKTYEKTSSIYAWKEEDIFDEYGDEMSHRAEYFEQEFETESIKNFWINKVSKRPGVPDYEFRYVNDELTAAIEYPPLGLFHAEKNIYYQTEEAIMERFSDFFVEHPFYLHGRADFD